MPYNSRLCCSKMDFWWVNHVFNNQTDTSTFSEDSGIAWSWTIDIPARATITKTAELSAGQVGTTQIIYDANGGTGEMDPTVDIPGEPIKLNKNTFTKDDYVFQGWDTNSAGTTVVYADEATLTMPDTDTTLYAVWKENPEITAAAEGFEGAYDGKEHGITVTVTDPSSGATIKYGKKAGTYDLDASPTITNVVDSPLTVYFKVTADGYKDYTGSATVTINEQKATYRMVSVTGATHVIGEGTAAVITVKRSENDTLTYKNFAGVSVDGKAVAESNYKKEEGSLVLTLKAAFLDTLSEGDHRVDITFTDGSVETTLRVTTMPGDVPKTGDNFSPAVCFLMLFLAILGIGGVTLSRMKE